jgi:putative membrane protein
VAQEVEGLPPSYSLIVDRRPQHASVHRRYCGLLGTAKLNLPMPLSRKFPEFSMEVDVNNLTLLVITGALLGSMTPSSTADIVSQVFIRDAIQANLAEIQMGQLAQEKAQSAEVKSYAQMLIADHSALNKHAEMVAEQIGITAPTETSLKQKALYDEMSKLTGATFDRTFAKEMATEHKMNIARYQNEAKKRNDPVADFANQTLPTLQKHLDAAQKLSHNVTFE